VTIRQHLAAVLEEEGDWKRSAEALVGIPLETGQKYEFSILMSDENSFCFVSSIG